jgi:hypothetical protein
MGNRDLDRAVAEHLGYVISRDIGREYYTYMLLDPSGRPVEANYYRPRSPISSRLRSRMRQCMD